MMIDELWPGGPSLYRAPDVLPLGTDSVLLSAFAASCTGVRSVCDLGCGSGVISILLAWNDPRLSVTGIELQPHAAELAVDNTSLNGLSHRINIVTADLRTYRPSDMAGSFDMVVSNPPYFPVNSGKSSENERISIAREERMCSMEDVCRAAAYLTRWGGRFLIVHRPERLSELCCRLSSNGLEPKRIRFVHSRAAALPSLVLLESRRGGKPGLSFEKPLIISNDDGSDTDELKAIYHRK